MGEEDIEYHNCSLGEAAATDVEDRDKFGLVRWIVV